MNEDSFEQWEARVRAMAGELPYPATPDLVAEMRQAARVPVQSSGPRRRRLVTVAGAAFLLLLVAGGLLAVPQVWAVVRDVLRIGAVRILQGEPSATPTPASTATVPLPTPTPLATWLDLAGETTLAEARAQAGFVVRLPAYPPDLGPPDRVFLQNIGGYVVVLVWLDPEQPGRVRLSLHELGPGTFAEKVQPPVVEETEVGGVPAVWTEGPYLLQIENQGYELTRLVDGHVLVWAEGQVTYRLESALSLEEARRIAESLQ